MPLCCTNNKPTEVGQQDSIKQVTLLNNESSPGILIKELIAAIKANKVDVIESFLKDKKEPTSACILTNNTNNHQLQQKTDTQLDKKLLVTLIYACCEYQRVELLGKLLKSCGFSSNVVNFVANDDNISCLMVAAKCDLDVGVQMLLEAGAKVNGVDKFGWTALMYASYYGCANAARRLLASNAYANAFDLDHISCLIWASGRGHALLVQLLLDSGAKVDACDKYGTTPLIWACRKGYTKCAQVLIGALANVNATGMFGWSALLSAVRGGYTDTTRVLLLVPTLNVNTCDAQRLSPLMIAAKEGFEDIVAVLVARGAFVNLSDRFGHTALIRAARGGHARIVGMLIEAKADINHIGFDKKTALFWATEKGHVDCVKYLLELPAKLGTKNASLEIASAENGETCLLRAVKAQRPDIVKLLLSSNAKVAATDKSGDNALHVAVRLQCKPIIELILGSAKNWHLIYKPNKRRETPFSIDQNNSQQVFAKILDDLESGSANFQASINTSPSLGIIGKLMSSSSLSQVFTNSNVSSSNFNAPITSCCSSPQVSLKHKQQQNNNNNNNKTTQQHVITRA